MATSFLFNGNTVQLPGVYSNIKSGIKNPPIALDFGNLLIIDTGSGANYLGGAGVAGTLENGANAVYEFDNIEDFRNYAKGGQWWLLAEPLFRPAGLGFNGVSKVTVIRATTTVPAEFGYTFTGGGTNGGTVQLQVTDEGKVGNAFLGDETKAIAVITVTAAGAAADTIAVVVGGTTVANYTVQTGDTIASVVLGLVASLQTLGIAELYSYNATTLSIKAPIGNGATINGTSPTFNLTGTVTATTTTFTGGVNGTKPTRGFAAKMSVGTIDPAKFAITFYRGAFTGIDENGLPYDGIAEKDTQPIALVKSVEFDKIQDLITWMNTNASFKKFFKLKTSSIVGTGVVNSADLTANSAYKLAAGGTENYATAGLLSSVFDVIKNQNYSFILADDFGANAQSADNVAILTHITTESKFKPELYIAAGSTVDQFATSLATATFYNNDSVTVVHGGVKKVSQSGTRLYNAMYKTAAILGREAGLNPQVPITFKNINIDGEQHVLTDRETIRALNAGLVVTRQENGSFDVVKGVNSLQNNTFLVNNDGTTHSKQIKRIARQLNKEIVVNAKQTLLKDPVGVNRNTLSQEDVAAWLAGYLTSKKALPGQDNLILSFQDITVVRQADAYVITYKFTPNSEISFLFFTGLIVNV